MADAPVEPTPEACKAALPILWPNGLPFALSDHDHREIRRVARALDVFAAQARTAAIESERARGFEEAIEAVSAYLLEHRHDPVDALIDVIGGLSSMYRALARPTGEQK